MINTEGPLEILLKQKHAEFKDTKLEKEDKTKDCWTGIHFMAEESVRREIDWFRTTIPENINHYLEHRGIDADDVLGISVDGGMYYVFYKKTVELETENLSGGSSRESSKGSKEC